MPSVLVDDIPAVTVDPPGPARGVALWLPYLGSKKEEVEPVLARLAEAGFAAASFDPWMHGARAAEDPDAIRGRVFAAFRREMWPILGRTTLDALRLVDWMVERTQSETPTVVAGGYSMGGDVAIALAGIDQRVRRVAAIGSTPDWSRPGMRSLDGTGTLIEQGTPSALGHWLYSGLDPISHPSSYDDPDRSFLFVSGEDDDHVPADGARRFAELVRAAVVISTVPGGHVDSMLNPASMDTCLAHLTG